VSKGEIGVYRRHRPETTALYDVVRDNIETLFGAVDDGALAVRIPKHARPHQEPDNLCFRESFLHRPTSLYWAGLQIETLLNSGGDVGATEVSRLRTESAALGDCYASPLPSDSCTTRNCSSRSQVGATTPLGITNVYRPGCSETTSMTTFSGMTTPR
jgi:hypothetical protein